MNDYINPFTAMGGLDTIENPFLRDAERAKRSALAAPFIDMARQNQIMDLTKKDSELGEWSSPDAVRARQLKLQENAMTSEHNMLRMPDATLAQNQENKDKVTLSPYLTEQKKQEAIELARQARGKPAERLFKEIGAANAVLRRAGDNLAARELLAQQFIKRWQDMNPGAQLPESMQKYDQMAWDMAEAISMYSIPHRQEMQKIESKNDSAEERARTMAEYAFQRQLEGDATRRYIADNKPGSSSNLPPNRAYVMDWNAFVDPQTPNEQKEILRKRLLGNTHLQERIAKEAKDATESILPGKDPVTGRDKRQTAIESYKLAKLKEMGLIPQTAGQSAPSGSTQRQLGTLGGYPIIEIKQNGDHVIQGPDGSIATIKKDQIKK